MRRSLFITLTLAVLSLCALVLSACAVSRGRDASYTVAEEQGYAESAGVSVSLRAAVDGKLNWQIGYDPVSGVSSDFTFSAKRMSEEYSGSASGIWLGTPFNFSMSSSGGDIGFDDDGGYMGPEMLLKDMLLDVASRAPAGQEHTERVHLADYYEYYPLDISGSLSAVFGDEYGNATSSAFGSDALSRALRGFFRIPVADDAYLTVAIAKNAAGGIYSIECNEDSGDLWIDTASLETDAGFYFSLTASRDGGKTVDLSCIPGGGGIYFIPYSTDADGTVLAELGAIACVYPLPAQTHVDAMFSAGGNVMLRTYDEGRRELIVLDLGAGKELQRVCITEDDTQRYPIWTFTEDGYFAFVYNDCGYTVYPLEGGLLAPGVSGELPEFFAGENVFYRLDNTATAFDGERFAVAAVLRGMVDGYRTPASCDIVLAVAGGAEPGYFCVLESSLKYADGLNYSQLARPFGEKPLAVSLG